MHRARHAVPPLPHQDPRSRDWKHPRIRFAFVRRSRLDVLGPFESGIRPITELAIRASGSPLPERDGCVVVPVYDLQVANIRAKFPDVVILDEGFSIPSLAQASIRYVHRLHGSVGCRTVAFPEAPDIALKLSIGIRISSALRTITHYKGRRAQAIHRPGHLDDRARGRQRHLRTRRHGRYP